MVGTFDSLEGVFLVLVTLKEFLGAIFLFSQVDSVVCVAHLLDLCRGRH